MGKVLRTKVDMVVQRLVVVLPVMVALGGFVHAQDVKEVVVASVKKLKGIKVKKIIWKKDGANNSICGFWYYPTKNCTCCL